jgi:hypothetical protein
MAGILSAIVEKVFGSAIEKAVAKKVAEGVAAAGAEKVVTTATADTVAAAAGGAARKIEAETIISAATKPAAEAPTSTVAAAVKKSKASATISSGAPATAEAATSTMGNISKIWNTGKAKEASWPAWIAGKLGRGTAKIAAVGIAYEAATLGGPPAWEAMTKKRPDAAQAPYDAKAKEAQVPRAKELRESIVKGDRPGSVPLVVPPPATNQPTSPDDAARRDLAARIAASRAAADVAANVAIDAASGPQGVAEVRGKSTWGKYLASVKEGGERQLAYENASPVGRGALMFRNADGVEVRVNPKSNVFVVSDPALLTSRAGTSAVEIEVFRLQQDGARGDKFDTIKIDKFPTPQAAPQRRGEVVPQRRPAVQPG